MGLFVTVISLTGRSWSHLGVGAAQWADAGLLTVLILSFTCADLL